VGLTFEDDVPDNTVLSRFRTELTRKDAYEKLMGNITLQLEEKGILLKKGAIVDASITDSPPKTISYIGRNLFYNGLVTCFSACILKPAEKK